MGLSPTKWLLENAGRTRPTRSTRTAIAPTTPPTATTTTPARTNAPTATARVWYGDRDSFEFGTDDAVNDEPDLQPEPSESHEAGEAHHYEVGDGEKVSDENLHTYYFAYIY